MTFQNAAVGMPIVSTNGFAQDDNVVTFRKEDGFIHHLPTGEQTPFIARNEVYFIQMQIPKSSVKNSAPDFGRHE